MSTRERKKLFDFAELERQFDDQRISDGKYVNKEPESSNQNIESTEVNTTNNPYAVFPQKPKINETHTLRSYLIRNDILERFNRMCEGKPRGYPTFLLNAIIERFLDEFEN